MLAAAYGAERAGIASASLEWAIAFAVVVVALLAGRGLYSRPLRQRLLEDVGHVVTSAAVAGMAILTARLLLGGDAGAAAADSVRLTVFAAVYVGAGRVAFGWGAKALWRTGVRGRPTLIIGAGRVGRLVARRLSEQPELGLRPVAFLDKEPLPTPIGGPDIPVVGASWDFDEVVDRYGIEQVVVAFSTARDDVFLRLVRRCHERGLDVAMVPRLYERMPDRLDVDRLGGLPLLTVRTVDPRGSQYAIKYALDPMLAALAIMLLGPVLLAAAIAVWIDSGRPILFRQTRVGRDGRRFEMLKFRSMNGSDGDLVPSLLEELRSGGIEGVDRRTRVGRLLRRTSVDELPQLFNVLKGEMSLVGPRPERVAWAAELERRVPRWDERTRVRAGITGWSQVHGLRGQTSLHDRAEWDNYYIENFSLWLDFKILVMTLGAVVRAMRTVE
jgi:exopolysaccharide biosynthesis polyprenyl glycosylphosphotransferase